MKKKICILGSTGSIGKTTLEIISKNKKDFNVVLLSGNNNVKLLISQAKKFNVCRSQSTFTKIKKELVKHGFLDPLDGGGLNAPAIFKISNRWNRYDNEDFKELKYKPGFGSKYFKEAMANPEKRQRIIQSRHGVS